MALITGASTGIGKELAIIHASKGDDLVLVARSEDKLDTLKEELQNEYGVNVFYILKDLSILGTAKEVHAEVKKLGLEIEYLVNNAGFGQIGKFHEISWQRQQEMINLNMAALTELTYLFLPDMIKRNSGRILNVSSTASLLPGPLQAVYYASKAYVTSLGNALAEELHDTNISVTNLLPGATETEFGAISGMDKTPMFQKMATASSVANDGYNAMMRGELDVVSGLTFAQKLIMKMIPFTPKKMLLQYVRQMQEVK